MRLTITKLMSGRANVLRSVDDGAAASSGCFETMRAYAGVIFRLESHLERLDASAKTLGVRMPGRQLLCRQLIESVRRSGLCEAIVRVALMPGRSGPAEPSIAVRPVPLPPASDYRRGIRVALVPARKFSVGSINPQAKYSARLGSVLAVIDAKVRGVDEALFLDAPTGSVTESTASNFGIVKHSVLLTPPCWIGLLAGITRDVLFELAVELKLPIREVPLTRHDLYNADEAFVSSTIKEVMPVTQIDGRRIGSGRPGPVTERLEDAFRELVARELRSEVG